MLYIFLFQQCFAWNNILDSQQINTTEALLHLNFTLNLQLLESENKLIITLVRLTEDTQSLLIICDTNSTQFGLNHLPTQNLECIEDYDSYLSNQTQIITLNKDPTSIEIRKLYNIYTITNNEPYVGIVSTGTINNISIILKEVRQNICAKPCQNNGLCVQGYCQCQISFIGTDCSIQLIDLVDQQKLLPNQNYFYHIKSMNEKSFLIHLSDQVSLIINCVHEFNQTIVKTNIIDLDQFMMQRCYKKTLSLEEQLPIQLHSYIIISQLQSQIGITPLLESDGLENLIFKIIPLVLFLLISLLIMFYCVRKNRKNSKIIKFVPVIKYAQALDMLDSTTRDNDCALCKKEITQNQSVRLTYCNHIFHDYCFKTWWTNNKNCPLCKSSLDLETLKKNQKSEIIQQSTFSNMQSYRKKNLVTFVDIGSASRQLPIQQKLESQIN